MWVLHQTILIPNQEKFDYTQGVIRSRKWKARQYKYQKKKDKQRSTKH
jgi:hypothetical protein